MIREICDVNLRMTNLFRACLVFRVRAKNESSKNSLTLPLAMEFLHIESVMYDGLIRCGLCWKNFVQQDNLCFWKRDVYEEIQCIQDVHNFRIIFGINNRKGMRH